MSEGGRALASVVGGRRVPPRMAALVNGATSHALDYDDTHFAHVGHLSVGIYPAALAIGETRIAQLGRLRPSCWCGRGDPCWDGSWPRAL